MAAYLVGASAIGISNSVLNITVGTDSAGTGSPSAPASGDRIALIVASGTTSTTWTITDSKSGTWTNKAANVTANQNVGVYYRTAGTLLASGDVVHATPGANAILCGVLVGIPTWVADDYVHGGVAWAHGSSTAPSSGSSGTLGFSTETAVWAFVMNAAKSISAVSPTGTLLTTEKSGSASPVIALYTEDVFSNAAITAAGTMSPTGGWCVPLFTFETNPSTSVTVTGVTPGTVTSASPVGVVEGDSVVTGATPGTVTAASPTGTVSGTSVVTGATPGTVTAAAPAGVVKVSVQGVTPSTVTAAAPVGTVKVGVTGATPGTVTAASPVGTVTVTSSVTVNGVAPGTVTAAAPVGLPKVAVNGVAPGTVTAAAPVGVVKVAVQGATPSTVTAASPVGSASGTARITGATPSTVTSAAPVGTVKVAATGAVPFTVTSASPVGAVNAGANVFGVAPGTVFVASPVGTVSVLTVRQPQDYGGSEADLNTYGGTATVNSQATPFGGTAVANTLGGTLSQLSYNGTALVTSPVFAGTAVTDNGKGGTASGLTFGGTQRGFTMQVQNITLGEFNDEVVSVALTQSGIATNLTGKSLKAYLKTAAGVDDTDPSTVVLASSGGSPAIIITSPSGGLATVAVSKTILTDPAFGFWRIDIVDGSGNQNTALYGTVTILNL